MQTQQITEILMVLMACQGEMATCSVLWFWKQKRKKDTKWVALLQTAIAGLQFCRTPWDKYTLKSLTLWYYSPGKHLEAAHWSQWCLRNLEFLFHQDNPEADGKMNKVHTQHEAVITHCVITGVRKNPLDNTHTMSPCDPCSPISPLSPCGTWTCKCTCRVKLFHLTLKIQHKSI